MTHFTESTIEQAAIDWLKDLGYSYAFGPEIAFDGETPERGDYQEALLLRRLQDSIARINNDLPAQAQEEALRKITRLDKPSLLLNNHAFHHMLVNGIEVEYKAKDGRMVSGRAYVVDFENPDNNDWLVVNQYTVEASNQNGKVNRRPDVVIFINGLPLAVIELKNAADENATIWSAFNQLQTYKHDIPALFHYNELLIISDGLNARFGSLTANKEWFLPWKTIEGESIAPASVTQLEVLLKALVSRN
jgi:type I restriction enzyme R subunit